MPAPRPVESSSLKADPIVERVDLGSGSWVDVVRGLVPGADDVYAELLESVPWQQGRVFRYERWIDEPRLSAWQAGSRRHPALAEAEASPSTATSATA